MDRAEWQQLAEDRVADAEALLAADRWSGAYYLAGYAVECALKSCVLAHLSQNPGIIFQEKQKKYSEQCWTHNLDDLIRLAGLGPELQNSIDARAELAESWTKVKDWKESSRYEQKTKIEAETLLSAVTNASDGILAWIKNHW